MVTDSVTSLDELSELSAVSVVFASDDELSDELLELQPHAAMDNAIVLASKSAIAFLNFICFSSLYWTFSGKRSFVSLPLTDDIIIRIYVKIINRCMFLKYGLMLYYCVLSIFFVRFSYFIRCFLRHFIYYSVFCCYFHIYHSVFFLHAYLYSYIYTQHFSIFHMVFLCFLQFYTFAHVYITQDLILYSETTWHFAISGLE